MEWLAIFVILMLAILAGILMYLPFFLWFRWRAEKTKNRIGTTQHITKTGMICAAALVAVLFGGWGYSSYYPDTWFGSQVYTFFGSIGYATVVCICFALIGIILEKLGLVFAFKIVVSDGLQENALSSVEKTHCDAQMSLDF